MKKTFLLFTLLFVSVICTACINNLAVQQLNDTAKAYMEKGEVDKAICRLKSSVDLDGNIFETRYNLAVALIENSNFKEAIDEIKVAQKLNPENYDTYYSLAVAQEGLAYDIITPKEEEQNIKFSQDEAPKIEEKKLSEEDKIKVMEYLTAALDSYNTYLSHKSDAAEKDEIQNHINLINEDIKKYNTQLPQESVQ